MRLSSTQKDVLFILYAIEQNGNRHPVPSMTILNMLNNNRSAWVQESNFRVSCHKLNGHSMINKYRTKSLTLAWHLSDEGREKARDIFNERWKHEKNASEPNLN